MTEGTRPAAIDSVARDYEIYRFALIWLAILVATIF